MIDKEVGVLWSWVVDDTVDVGLISHAQVRALIHKLVEERYNRSLKTLPEVLASFGIPEEGWVRRAG